MNEDIKRVADRIYYSNPKKFVRLVVWIRQAEKYKFETVVIVTALERFEKYAASVGDNWYPYLDKLIKKVDGDINADRSLSEHELHKEEVRDASKGRMFGLVKGLANAKKS